MSPSLSWIAGASLVVVLPVLLKAKTVLWLRGTSKWTETAEDSVDHMPSEETENDHLPPNVIRGRSLL